MKSLKLKWKKSIGTDMEAAFSEIESALRSDCLQFNDLSLLKFTFNENSQKLRLQLIQSQDASIAFNNVNYALLKLVDSLEEKDLQPNFLNKDNTEKNGNLALHEHHKFTCDRIDQSDRFHQVFSNKRAEKVHFFTITGIDLQSHEGIFKRFAYDLEGRLLDYLNPGLTSECASLKLSITFDSSRDLTIYKQNILKSLFTAMSLPPGEHEPILEKNLHYLLEKSPQMGALGKEDFVCILLNISQWDWDSKITPVVTRWLITEFCKTRLPENSPTFFFFFGIVMDEDDEEMQTEIREAIDNSEFIKPLPELEMVKAKDVSKWLAKYNFVVEGTRERKQKVKEIFSFESEKYMEDVEIDLQKIIDEYNNKLM
ncbi:MAG: hypothetical protein ACI9XO_003325 [Paraglaciecola sp.]|jgi:hypothetical protein